MVTGTTPASFGGLGVAGGPVTRPRRGDSHPISHDSTLGRHSTSAVVPRTSGGRLRSAVGAGRRLDVPTGTCPGGLTRNDAWLGLHCAPAGRSQRAVCSFVDSRAVLSLCVSDGTAALDAARGAIPFPDPCAWGPAAARTPVAESHPGATSGAARSSLEAGRIVPAGARPGGRATTRTRNPPT
ncbi:MAG: hypothetical protein JJLCMIEE_02190 [Acidimicrobiales bacterium]|nr:hypothetical protein [Acidimicrobiales bacterium]